MLTLRTQRILSSLALALAVAACGNTQTKMIPSTGSILPNSTLQIGPTIAYSVEEIVVAGAAAALLYVIYDPLAPNWNIEEKRLSDDTYYLALRAKSFRVGGDGEAVQIIKRRAVQLQREKGYTGYRLLDYSEGIESSTPLTHRVSEGTIQLVKAQQVPSR